MGKHEIGGKICEKMGEVEKRHPRGVIKGARTGKTREKAFIIHWGDKC